MRELGSLSLAHIGDGIYEVFARQLVLSRNKMTVAKLHYETVRYVNAKSQAKAIEAIYDKLTEHEIAVYKRGKNANSHTIPKNTSVDDYRKSTGLEALFGYLYIKKEFKRLRDLFDMIASVIDNNFKLGV